MKEKRKKEKRERGRKEKGRKKEGEKEGRKERRQGLGMKMTRKGNAKTGKDDEASGKHLAVLCCTGLW